MDGCPSEWGASPQDFCPMWLNFLIFTKKTLLICVERDCRFSGGYATEEEIGQAFE